MISGRVNWLLEATVSVELQDVTGNYHEFQCVLDTGFTGYIALPADSIDGLGLARVGLRNTVFLDSHSASLPFYDGIVLWHGEPIRLEVLQTDHESVIGMGLLENSTLTVEVWDDGNVLIEPR